MRGLLALAAGTEVATGVGLVFAPSLLTRLLFGGDLSGVGRTMAPLAGFGLLGLAAACWPTRDMGSPVQALRTMFCFSLLVVLYLVYAGVTSGEVGVLLWPAAAGHSVLGLLLARAWLAQRKQASSG